MGIIGTVLTLGGGVAGLILFGLFARRASQVGLGPAAAEVAESVGTLGTSIGSVGTGFLTLGTGIGGGISGLFKPFIDLFNLFNPAPQATAQNTAIKSATQPATTQQSTTTPVFGSFAGRRILQPTTGSSLVTGFLAGPGGL